MNEQETIADIIAEMRALSNPISDGIIAINGRIIADRLEAAHRREVATTKESLAVGNSGDCAKLREALIKLRSAIYRDEDGDAHIAPDIIVENIIDTALAAPPRNCDRPECATTKAAADVWRKEDGGKTAYHEWLLAPATEQKGDNDGSK